MSESQSWAIATQQAHKLGKTPKGYGTREGKLEAKAKFDKPKSEYRKTAESKDVRMLSPDYTERVGKMQQKVAPHIVGGAMGIPLAAVGAAAGDLARGVGSTSKLPVAAGALLGAGAGYGLGRLAWHRQAGGRDFGKGERRAALRVIREAKKQGYNPVLVDKRSEAEFDKIKEILRKKASVERIKIAAFTDELEELMKEAWNLKALESTALRGGKVREALQRVAGKVGWKEAPYVKKFGPGGSRVATKALERGTIPKKKPKPKGSVFEMLSGVPDPVAA